MWPRKISWAVLKCSRLKSDTEINTWVLYYVACWWCKELLQFTLTSVKFCDECFVCGKQHKYFTSSKMVSLYLCFISVKFSMKVKTTTKLFAYDLAFCCSSWVLYITQLCSTNRTSRPYPWWKLKWHIMI